MATATILYSSGAANAKRIRKVRCTKLVKGQLTKMGRVVSVARIKWTPNYNSAGKPKNVVVRYQNKGLRYYTAHEFVELYSAA